MVAFATLILTVTLQLLRAMSLGEWVGRVFSFECYAFEFVAPARWYFMVFGLWLTKCLGLCLDAYRDDA